MIEYIRFEVHAPVAMALFNKITSNETFQVSAIYARAFISRQTIYFRPRQQYKRSSQLRFETFRHKIKLRSSNAEMATSLLMKKMDDIYHLR